MKKLNLSQKILLMFVVSVAFTILFSFFFIHFLYSELYLKSIEESLVYQGQRTASHYHYGELSDDIIEKIQWFNVISEYEVIAVDDLEQLSTYFPYQINYENLIDDHDREQLERGTYVVKNGFVEELDREILGAIFPIKGEQGLVGFIYMYIPLATIQVVFQQSIPLLAFVGTLFFLLLFLIVNRVWVSMFEPLRQLQVLSKEVSKGNYSSRLQLDREDEVGQLANAFNAMSLSLEEQEKRKKEFTSNIVHEVRTPLTYISGYAHALESNIYESPEEAKQYLVTIQKETERLNKLMTDLVELNHLQEDMYTLEKQPIALAQLLLDTLELFSIHIVQKGLTLQTNIDEDIIMSGDAQRLQQVFYNTLDNAIKYSAEDGVLNVSLQEEHYRVTYRVTNGGVTISQEDIHRIGERFFRTDKARTRTTGGTGLGLSIVKEIVRLHNGTFEITSSPKVGTTVTIEFEEGEA
ncbi:HAMP domain-containing histidine kinase [Savagea sp. SN6]|uniref:histidine kinase n=1 Tax=Savagea serpentis TaxID=2785297 RepID=A0A8J7GAE6_9BACL|nr:HAMP domain-containing sensor histidine kinase [Savagea serpentis]MBF4499731.1 HAMP domain-containing histidine kinase [Savagea serpentis]